MMRLMFSVRTAEFGMESIGSANVFGTVSSGLIDDVRIYDHVLTAEEIAALAQ